MLIPMIGISANRRICTGRKKSYGTLKAKRYVCTYGKITTRITGLEMIDSFIKHRIEKAETFI